jgi:predicted dehydrogenase
MPMMKRRQFLQTACTAAAVPFFIPRSALADVKAKRPGANDRIGLAGIGVGRQGGGVFNSAASDKRTQVVAVCDVFKPRALQFAEKYKIPAADAAADYRKVIDNKNVDAIVTATPEHWRSLICVNAMLAGKHLYVEKPITLTVEDGILMRKAAAKTGIVFQCGSMQRSMAANYLACQFIREGNIGKVKEIYAGGYESPWRYAMSGETVPEGLDWDLWCGPAGKVPFHSQLFVPRGKPGWISFWEYSGGEMTGWGTHGFDQIQCALGKDDTGPVEVIVEGDKLVPPVWKEPQEKKTGDVFCSQPKLSFRYADGTVVKLGDKENKGDRGGGTFIGEKGTVIIWRNKWKGVGDTEVAVKDYQEKHKDVKLPGHTTDWINCIYSGKQTITPLESGIRTAEICHILNIARYAGHNLKWDPAKEEFAGDREANKYLARKHSKGFEQPKVDGGDDKNPQGKERTRPVRRRMLWR